MLLQELESARVVPGLPLDHHEQMVGLAEACTVLLDMAGSMEGIGSPQVQSFLGAVRIAQERVLQVQTCLSDSTLVK